MYFELENLGSLKVFENENFFLGKNLNFELEGVRV